MENTGKIQSVADYEAFRGTTDVLPVAIVIATPDESGHGVISFMNTHALNMFGYTNEEIIGQPTEILIPNSFKETHRKKFKLAAETRTINAKYPRVLVARKKDGMEIPIRISMDFWETELGIRFVAAAIEIV